eukprot:14579452-Ditylum_brightwellii.AAC.1
MLVVATVGSPCLEISQCATTPLVNSAKDVINYISLSSHATFASVYMISHILVKSIKDGFVRSCHVSTQSHSSIANIKPSLMYK